MNNYICQFCKQLYQSNEERKPKSYRKDGSIYQYYDSSKFCSKECCKKQAEEKHKQTLKSNPNIIKQAREKQKITYENNPNIKIKQKETRKQTLKSNPNIMKQAAKKRRQTLKDHPGIRKQISESVKQAYKNHPEIIEKQKEKLKQTLKSNPNIMKQAREKQKITYKNNPEIMRRKTEKLKQTYRNNPEILKRISESLKQTYRNNPEIIEKQKETHKQTLKKHPEIIEKQQNKAYQTMKESNFISKEEQQMIQLLKNKYGEDNVIEQYRDDRYMKPGTNYHYACDCYIKSLDLFIEFNGSRFHPKEEDRDKLLEEIKKFQIKYPNRNIEECQAYALLDTIEKDKIKQQVARDNKLNYLIVTDGFKELYATDLI